jgi:3'(2'), 5'-bisphosphate nucleotidase
MMNDADLASLLAFEAGKILLDLQKSWDREAALLGKAGDAQANAYLVNALRDVRPDDGLLSEEEKDNLNRLKQARVWIIDPVDGTREYGEGRTDWAVHVALTEDGRPVIGAVALPGLGVVLRSDQPLPPPPPPVKPRMVVSRTRPAQEALDVAAMLGAEIIAMGSAGAKAMAVVRGEAEIYLHTGGQYEWDSCAPAAVAMAHGLHVSRIDGSPLIYNQADVYMPDLLICRREWAERILALMRDHIAGAAGSAAQ